MLNRDLMKDFSNTFGDSEGAKTYFAPGRVNLIGEHTDYNGGHVFPCALTIGTYAVARKRDDNIVRMFSLNFSESGIREMTLNTLFQKQEGDWTNYPKGMIYTLIQGGYGIDKGLDILFYGTLPNSSGLSSSASIEVLTGYVCMDLYGLDYDMTDLALICQHSENRYNGVPCGVMDQFAIAMGKKGRAIYLNTQNLAYQYVPFVMKSSRIVIMNTNKKRELADSKYNERRSECEKALKQVQNHYNIKFLCDLSISEWENASKLITDECLRKRAHHVVFENQRTKDAVQALVDCNYEKFGQLMNESHCSLRDDYEVTGLELDTLVETAWNQEGVLGARMTGAGFGGCAIAVVENECIDAFQEKVKEQYVQKIGYEPDFYIVKVGGRPEVL